MDKHQTFFWLRPSPESKECCLWEWVFSFLLPFFTTPVSGCQLRLFIIATVPCPKRFTGRWVRLSDLHLGIPIANCLLLAAFRCSDHKLFLAVPRFTLSDSPRGIYFSWLTSCHELFSLQAFFLNCFSDHWFLLHSFSASHNIFLFFICFMSTSG